MRNLALKVIDRLVIAAYGDASPTDEEWAHYLEVLERLGIEWTMHLIAIEGGGPTPAQRRRLNALVAGHAVPVAVISDRVRVRGRVTLLSWFNQKIAAFPPSGVRDAIAYLEIPSRRADLIERELCALLRELDEGREASNARLEPRRSEGGAP